MITPKVSHNAVSTIPNNTLRIQEYCPEVSALGLIATNLTDYLASSR